MKTYRYNSIDLDALTSTDLRTETRHLDGAEAYSIVIFDGERQMPETAEAVFCDGRLGVAWGADASWADASDIESGIEMWLNDRDAWAALN